MAEYRSEMQKAWFAEMRAKFDTDDEGVREIMRQRQKQSMNSPKRKEKPHRGGFSNPERARAAGAKGRQSRYGQSALD